MNWEDAQYNLVRPHKGLWLRNADTSRSKWQPRTPAMTAELTDPIRTDKELLSLVLLSKANDTH